MFGQMTCGLIAVMFATSAQAQSARYDLFPEPDVRRTPTNWVNSAYVVDKRENQFWICTARYDFASKEPNKGECTKLSSDIGRPSIAETNQTRVVTGSTPYGPFLPVVWFIEPTMGDVQFCAVRASGVWSWRDCLADPHNRANERECCP